MSYTQLYDPGTPQEALSGLNIAFRGLRKISTAEQFRLRNSLLQWKDLENLVFPHTQM